MDDIHAGRRGPEDAVWSKECARAAETLRERLGPDGVAWLDDFLADYVFIGDPLDRVLAEARDLCDLPPRRLEAPFDDD